jgi:hypothetical protein
MVLTKLCKKLDTMCSTQNPKCKGTFHGPSKGGGPRSSTTCSRPKSAMPPNTIEVLLLYVTFSTQVVPHLGNDRFLPICFQFIIHQQLDHSTLCTLRYANPGRRASKARVCGRSLAGIADSNPDGDMDVFLF